MNRGETAAQRLRLFVALELPETWLQALTGAQTRLRQLIEANGGPGLRWVRPEGIHLKLKFLGEVAAERLAAIEEALAAAVPSAPGLSLRLGEPSFFGSQRRVSVVWVGLEGDVNGLTSLAARIDSACEDLAFRPETRPFAAHLTLGRLPDGSNLSPDALSRHLKAVHFDQTPAVQVERVSLMRSHLGAGGSRYERLRSWPD